MEEMLWIMVCILARSDSLNLKRLDESVSYKQSFSLHKMLIDGLEWCGLVVDYCDVFICLDSHSDGTHSLQRIHLCTSDEMLHFSKSVPVNKLIYTLNGRS